MIAVISPAKSLQIENYPEGLELSEPRLLKDSKALSAVAKKLASEDLQKMMKISAKLGDLNVERFKQFKVPMPEDLTAPALWAFQGDVYQGFDAETLPKKLHKRADKSIRMLSGLYGLLRPMDRMMAYRLEMGTSFPTKNAKNLYEFWGGKIAQLLAEDLSSHKDKTLINLASQEYFKAVQTEHLPREVLTCDFKERKDGKVKIVSFFAKKARGRMARWIVEENPTSAEDLKEFALDDYEFSPSHSKPNHYVFVR